MARSIGLLCRRFVACGWPYSDGLGHTQTASTCEARPCGESNCIVIPAAGTA